MSTDLIADVMRAADTSSAKRAQSKLLAMAQDTKAKDGTGSFQKLMSLVSPRALKAETGRDLVAQVMAAADPQKIARATSALNALDDGATMAVAAVETLPDTSKSLKSLEGALLSGMFENMLPKAKDSGLYGDGTSGDYARSLQVQQFADAAAETGVINLDELVEAANDKLAVVEDKTATLAIGAWPYFQSGRIRSFAAA